ncbi:MAG: hypothetical protein QW175_07895, partial [Candidatus Bathyarchaeia archaeon]
HYALPLPSLHETPPTLLLDLTLHYSAVAMLDSTQHYPARTRHYSTGTLLYGNQQRQAPP